jgi:hypothetical protein
MFSSIHRECVLQILMHMDSASTFRQPWIYLALAGVIVGWMYFRSKPSEIEPDSSLYQITEQDIVSDLPGAQLHIETPAL